MSLFVIDESELVGKKQDPASLLIEIFLNLLAEYSIAFD